MQINIEQIDNLVADADKVFINPEAEDVLLQLLDIKDQVDAAIDAAEKKLEEAALRINPVFKSLKADRVKVFYREYGTKYAIDVSLIDKIPENLYTKEIKYVPVSEAVEKWTSEHDGMPLGIIEKERTKSLSFSRKKTAENAKSDK
jgi:hypothetical protein